MKKRFIIFVFLLLPAVGASAQIKEARKISEFENTNCDGYRSRMDFLLKEVSNSPNSKGYVFVYEGKLKLRIYNQKTKSYKVKFFSPEIGSAKALIGYFKDHLRFRSFPSDKIVFVEAGFREKYDIELWVAPNEADAPKPTPTLKKIKQRKPKPSPLRFCGEM